MARDDDGSVERRAEAAGEGSGLDDGYRLPRTISPIGLFFGSGAPDPRKAGQGSEASCVEEGGEGRLLSRPPRAPFGTPLTRFCVSLGVTAACGLFYLLLLHIPLDPGVPTFWLFAAWLAVVFAACQLFLRGSRPSG